jgi:6-hydroxy-3-succinoylpyridine 3-monooxygenase
VAASPGLPLPRQRTAVYVDGFNLYYGAVRGTPNKWLDLAKLFRLLRPHDDIQVIRYFTAMVNGPTKANQEAYLQALGTTPIVDPVLGNFKNKRVLCSLGPCTYTGKRFFEIPEEKRTDVNIAVYMVDDAYQNIADQIVLVSGDSDLVPAVRMVRSRFPGKQVSVYVPAQHPTRSAAVELRSAANRHRELPLNLLPLSQFPSRIADGAGGFISKPAAW